MDAAMEIDSAKMMIVAGDILRGRYVLYVDMNPLLTRLNLLTDYVPRCFCPNKEESDKVE